MMITHNARRRLSVRGPRLLLLTAGLLLLPTTNMAQQVLDLCGCAGTPGLQPFNAGVPSTYPPGTSGCSSNCSSGTIVIGLPPDGILRFSSFTVDGGFQVFFARNLANTPATILVAGDVLIRSGGCCQNFSLGGNSGSAGTSAGTAGVGGFGGAGGFRGGDGSALAVNGFDSGGSGLGPGGGTGGTPTAAPGGGVFFGLPELLPLMGGSGGGGGGGFGTLTSCTGGGGGGGGGGLLIAANGTFTMQNYTLDANGGPGGSVGNSACARGGSGGSGGAIRIVAARMVSVGSQSIQAVGGGGGIGANTGSGGRIRLETLDASAQTSFDANPAAIRITGPGPIANPVSPTVRITSVGGQTPPAIPQGGYGAIDVVLATPGVTSVDLATAGIPSGTTVLVSVKPRVGGSGVSATVPLDASSCNVAGECTATTAFNLSAGAYVVEARATFQVQ